MHDDFGVEELTISPCPAVTAVHLGGRDEMELLLAAGREGATASPERCVRGWGQIGNFGEVACVDPT